MEDLNTIDAIEEDYLYVSTSGIENAGNGLYTAIKIYKGEIVSLFLGEILTENEIAERVSRGADSYFISMLDGAIMDSATVDCYAKYANDAQGCTLSDFKNNCKIALDEFENICIVATRNIQAGEEIFVSYGKRYWKKHGLS